MGAIEVICEITDDWFSFCPTDKATIIYNAPKIIDAYFVEKKIVDVPIEGGSADDIYTVKPNDNLSKIASKDEYKGISFIDIAKANNIPSPYKISIGQKLIIPNGTKKTKKETQYEKIDKASLGSKVYLYAKTKYFKDGDNITFKIYEDGKILVEDNIELPILKDGSETKEVEGKVVKKKDSEDGEVAIEIELRPKDDTTYKEWKEKFKEDKKDKLYLKVSSSSYESIEEKEFVRSTPLLIEFHSCYCKRDFTVDEVKSIVKKMRESEGSNNTDLFSSSNCSLSSSDKTYESFTKELNTTMTKYKIDSCLRKMHFLVQIYHETDRLKTTKEYGSATLKYDPYRGRGLMQLTWKGNYERYKKASGVDVVTNYNYVSDNLSYAVDSGGWYWEKGSAWGGLNKRADNDDIYKINIGVNGGFNGFKERILYAKKLIGLMKIKDCKNVKLEENKELGVYKYSTSSMRTSNYGKNHKSKFKDYDD